MPAFEYEARVTQNDGEQVVEWGTVVAKTREEAKKKIVSRGWTTISLHRLKGLKGLLKALTPDVK